MAGPEGKDALAAAAQSVAAVIVMARTMTVEQAAALLDAADHIETLLPYTDPTAYLREAKGIAQNIRVLRTFLTFRRAVEEEVQRLARGQRR